MTPKKKRINSGKIVRKLIKILNLKLSPESQYSTKHFIGMLLEAIDRKLTPEAVARLHPETFPSSDTFYRFIKSQSIKDLEKAAQRLRRYVIGELNKRGVLRGMVDIAIDNHLRPYYGKKKHLDYIVGKRAERGTAWGYGIATVSIVTVGVRLPLGWEMLRKSKSKVEIMKQLHRLAKKCINVRYLLLDREFYQGKVIEHLNSTRQLYVMAAKETKPCKRRRRKGKDVRFTHQVGPEKADTKIVILSTPDEKRKYHYYATNATVPPEKLAEKYDERWAEETTYRTMNSLRLKTRSTDERVQYFCNLVAQALCCFWVLENVIGREEIVIAARQSQKARKKYDTAIRAYEFTAALARVVLGELRPSIPPPAPLFA